MRARARHSSHTHPPGRAQTVFERKSEYQINDSADYFFNGVERISAAGYEPTEQDVLRSRVCTRGIAQSDFTIRGTKFSMFDVGGQRSARRKWIHLFDNVHAVVFVAALPEYDQVLFEDETMNRMDEALQLFDQARSPRIASDGFRLPLIAPLQAGEIASDGFGLPLIAPMSTL